MKVPKGHDNESERKNHKAKFNPKWYPNQNWMKLL